MHKESWKSKYFGSVTIHHLAQYNPNELMGTLMGSPAERHGRAPKVLVYPFQRALAQKPEAFAVRHFPRETGFLFFQLLKECTQQGIAVIEKPLAMVDGIPADQVAIVTRWKGGKNLAEFLKDESIRESVKNKAAKKLMEQIAILHAMGFVHGHLRLDNAVGRIGKRGGSASLVDYTRMSRANGEEESKQHARAYYMAKDLSDAIYYKLDVSRRLPRPEFQLLGQKIRRFQDELYEHYLKIFEKTRVKLEEKREYLKQKGSKTQQLEPPKPEKTMNRFKDWLAKILRQR